MYRGWVCVARSHHICGKSVHETEAISVGIANQQGSHSEWGIAYALHMQRSYQPRTPASDELSSCLL